MGCRHRGEIHVNPLMGLDSSRLLEHQVIEIETSELTRGTSCIAPGQKEKVFDHALHPDYFFEKAAQHRLLLRICRAGEIDFELRPDPGQGAPHLMGSVGHEALLAVD